MASGVVASPAQVNGQHKVPALSELQLQEVSEYEKIIRLHDDVLAGKHPRLKIPAALAGKLPKQASQAAAAASPRPAAAKVESRPTNAGAAASLEREKIANDVSSKSQGKPSPSSVQKAAASVSTSDRVSLENSDELVRTEIRLKRQLLENALREKLARKKDKSIRKVSNQDAIPDFDVSEALAQALKVVKPYSRSESYGKNHRGSGDESTFYSSVDSPFASTEDASEGRVEQGKGEGELDVGLSNPTGPSSPKPLQIHEDPPEQGSRADVQFQPEQEVPRSAEDAYADRPPSPRREVGTRAVDGGGHVAQDENALVPLGVGSLRGRRSPLGDRPQDTWPSEPGRHEQRDDEPLRTSDRDPQVEHPPRSQLSPDVPIIRRSHIRSPFAPQPARVSPLAVARLPAVGLERDARRESLSRPFSARGSLPSPGPSAQLLRPSKRRRYEVDSRYRHEPETQRPQSPEQYIKQEPISPRPLTVTEDRPVRLVQHPHGRRGPDRGDERREALPIQTRDARASPPRYERVYPETPTASRFSSTYPHDSLDRSHKHRADFHRYASFQGPRPPRSPPAYHIYSPTEIRSTRAISRGVFERPVRENVQYIHEHPGPYRGQVIRSERPRSPVLERFSPSDHGSVVMTRPSRAQLPRLAIEEHGRRYVEAPSSGHDRHSMVPPTSYSVVSPGRPREAEPDVEHFHMPVRVSDRPYAERSYIEHGPPSPRLTMRRMVEDPERSEVRTYRPREYSGRPSVIIPREEYIYTREAPERRTGSFEEVIVPRNYLEPAPSSGGGGGGSGRFEHGRYEVAPPPPHRLESRMPESEVEEFGPRYQAGGRRLDVVPQTLREYSVRADEGRREYIPAPSGERYTYIAEHAAPPPHAAPFTPAAAAAAAGGRRFVDEVRYVESPRDAPPDGEGWRRASYRY